MKCSQFLVCTMLLLTATSLNNLQLGEWQANLTKSQNVTACDLQYYGMMVAIAHQKTLSVWRRLDGNVFSNTQNISVGDPIKDVKIKLSGTMIAVLIPKAVVIYTDFQGTFKKLQKISLNVTAISWSIDFNLLLTGLGNGSILVHIYNDRLRQFSVVQTLLTSHTAINKIDSQSSSLVACGTNDTILTVFYYDLAKEAFVLNQVIRDIGSGECTALQFSPWEDRIVLGQSDGDITLFKSNDDGVYALEMLKTKAHGDAISALAMTHNSAVLVSAGQDGNVSMWTQSDNFTYSEYMTSLNATCLSWSPAYREVLVGVDAKNNSALFRLNATNCEKSSNGSKCICNEGRTWYRDNCSVLNCTNDPHSTGKVAAAENQSCSCNGGYQWLPERQQCGLDCSAAVTPNARRLHNLHVCRCLLFTYWDNQKRFCRPDCAKMGLDADEKKQSACKCTDGFDWTPAASCQINCSNVAHSTSKQENSTACQCKNGFKWNDTLLTCDVIKAVNCSTIQNAATKNIDELTCRCKSGYIWNSTKYVCEVDCKLIANATGEDGKSGCTCLPGLVYINNTKICTSGISCKGLRNSPGTNRDIYSCNCFNGYTYRERIVSNVKVGGCEVECSRYSRTQDQHDPAFLSCRCFQGYIWNSWPPGCIISCAGRVGSTGRSTSVLECECQQGFKWNFNLQHCERFLSTAVKFGMAFGLLFGIAGLIFIAAIVCKVCCKKGPAEMRRGEAYNVSPHMDDGPPVGTDVRLAIEQKHSIPMNTLPMRGSAVNPEHGEKSI